MGGTVDEFQGLAMRSRDRSRDNTRAERGGDPLHHRSCDITHIGGILCALGQWWACRISSLYKHGIRTFFVRKRARPGVALGTRFFAYSVLIISFKGVPIKLKIVALAISVG